MKKIYCSSFLVFFCFMQVVLAQKTTWIMPLQKGWKFENGSFQNADSIVGRYDSKKDQFVFSDLKKRPQSKAVDKDSILQFYDGGYPLGNIAYVVKKYEMTAVVNNANEMIWPYSKDIRSVDLLNDTAIIIRELDYHYTYNSKGKLIKFEPQYNNTKVGVYRAEYKENYLFDFEHKTKLSGKYVDLNRVYPFRNVFIALNDNYYGIINDKNEPILPFEFNSIVQLKDSFFLVKKNKESSLFHLETKKMIPLGKKPIEGKRNGILIQEASDEKVNVYLLNGKKISNKSFVSALKTDDDVIFCAEREDQGFIFDTNGKQINTDTLVSTWFLDQHKMNNQAHLAQKKSGWGIQRKDGTWLVPPFCSKNDIIKDNFIVISKNDIAKFKLDSVKTSSNSYYQNYYFDLNFRLLYPYPCVISKWENCKDTFKISTNDYENLITGEGKMLFPMVYNQIRSWNNLLYCNRKNYTEIYNQQYKQIIFQSDSIKDINAINKNILLATDHKGKKGILDTNRKWIVPMMVATELSGNNNMIFVDYETAKTLNVNNLDTCKSCKEKTYILDFQKKPILKSPAKIINSYRNFIVIKSKEKVGLISPDLNIALAPTFDEIIPYSPKAIVVKNGLEYGIISIE